MPVYHQMGHDSENLIYDKDLSNFRGVILSPVNRSSAEIIRHVSNIRNEKQEFDVIFDPQLYFPRGQRETLRQWDYFPNELETHDVSDFNWWKNIVVKLVASCESFQPDGICSPMLLPRGNLNADYYDLFVKVGDKLFDLVDGSGARSIQTVLVKLPDLEDISKVYELASIISRAKSKEIYLIFTSEVEPRRELSQGDDIKGGMLLISLLNSAGYMVTVGMTSSDMVLWKAAGANACATGKYFNLRRFSESRFDEATKGGRVIPYCFEEELLSFVREGDLLRLDKEGIVSDSNKTNPAFERIVERLHGEYSPWLADSWRQFMYWFDDAESRIEGGLDVEELLITAELGWSKVDDAGILMEEVRNDGSWVRIWRRTLREFRAL